MKKKGWKTEMDPAQLINVTPDEWEKIKLEIREERAREMLDARAYNACPVCEADLDTWREVFGETHYCHAENCVVVDMRGEG